MPSLSNFQTKSYENTKISMRIGVFTKTFWEKLVTSWQYFSKMTYFCDDVTAVQILYIGLFFNTES